MASIDLEYYAYLAQVIPPAELARAIATRARKTLGKGVKLLLEKSGAKPFFFDVSPEVKRRRAQYALTHARPALMDGAERERTAALLREKFPEACAFVQREAEACRRGELPVFGKWKSVSNGTRGEVIEYIDYARDPIAHDVVYDVKVPGPRVKLFVPGADAKAAWEVGRMQHLWRFAQARWLAETAGERTLWARAFMESVRQFRAACPAGFGVQWSVAMEVSARAMHIAMAFAYVQDDPAIEPGFVAELFDMLEEHCLYIEEHLEETGAIRTNHYAADLVGLVVVGALFPELPRSRVWLRDYGRKLWEEIPRQCREDGTHFESSMGYQRLIGELFLAAILGARAGGAPAPREVEHAVAGLFRSLGDTLKPSGNIPQLGDLDSCRGLPLMPRTPLDCGYLPALGAAILGDPTLKLEGAPCPVEVAWLLGPSGFARFDKLPAQARPGNALLKDGGIGILRNGTGYLCLTSGPNGQGGTGGHAHNDKNGVELSFGSVDLIVDRGTFVYARDPAERNARRGTAGHSTVQVDGKEQNRIVPGRLFALPDRTRARVLSVEGNVATGEHHGYQKYGVLHRRIAALLPDAAAFTDELLGTGEHSFDVRWIVPHTGVSERPAAPAERERLAALSEHGHYDLRRCVEVRDAAGKAIALFAFGATLPWQLSVAETDISPGYAEKAPARLIALQLVGAVPARIFTAALVL
jgi:hypothetical protein